MSFIPEGCQVQNFAFERRVKAERRHVQLRFVAKDGDRVMQSMSVHGASPKVVTKVSKVYNRYGVDIVQRFHDALEMISGPRVTGQDGTQFELNDALPADVEELRFEFDAKPKTTPERQHPHGMRAMLHAWQDNTEGAHATAMVVSPKREHTTPLYATTISESALQHCKTHGMVTAQDLRNIAKLHPNMVPKDMVGKIHDSYRFTVITDVDLPDTPVRRLELDEDLEQQFDVALGIGGDAHGMFMNCAANLIQNDLPACNGETVKGYTVGFALDTDTAWTESHEVEHLKNLGMHHDTLGDHGKMRCHVLLNTDMETPAPLMLRTADTSMLALVQSGIDAQTVRDIHEQHLMGTVVPSMLLKCTTEPCRDSLGNTYMRLKGSGPVDCVTVIPADGLASQINFGVLSHDVGHPSVVYASMYVVGNDVEKFEQAVIKPFEDVAY